jgi:hypothetical protein
MTPIETALAAVDEEIASVREWGKDRLLAEAERCADLLASNGVMLWWPDDARRRQRRIAGRQMSNAPEGVVEPDPDEVRTALSRGLAILALRPHGVEFDTAHFCDGKHDGCERGSISFPHEPSDDHRARGAVFTPRHLAEEVTVGALEPLVYRPGPLDTANQDEWQPVPVKEVLTKTVADIAAGCGVFLVAAVRYLTEKVMDRVPEALKDKEQWFRAVVIARCVYGVDIHPGSVAIARLVLALLVPLFDIDVQIYRHVLCGDSLLGITSLDQLRWMHLDPEKGREVHQVQPLSDELLGLA